MGNRQIKTILILGSLMLGGLFLTRSVWADEITFEFTAQVTQSSGTDNFTGGAIAVNSTLTGSMTFDTDAPDQNSSSSYGTYVYQSPTYTSPIGMIVQQGSNVLETDPANMSFSIALGNDNPSGTGTSDFYSVASLNNLPPPLPLTHSGAVNMDIQMSDAELGITSDALPLTPPQLTTASGTQSLFIHGNDDSTPIFVKANITSFTLKVDPTVESTLNDLKTFVGAIPAVNLKNANMSNALIAKIDAALAMLAVIESETDPTAKEEAINELHDKLVNDILAKGDGCDPAPDHNDWIQDCASQYDYQAVIQEILDLLDTL